MIGQETADSDQEMGKFISGSFLPGTSGQFVRKFYQWVVIFLDYTEKMKGEIQDLLAEGFFYQELLIAETLGAEIKDGKIDLSSVENIDEILGGKTKK